MVKNETVLATIKRDGSITLKGVEEVPQIAGSSWLQYAELKRGKSFEQVGKAEFKHYQKNVTELKAYIQKKSATQWLILGESLVVDGKTVPGIFESSKTWNFIEL